MSPARQLVLPLPAEVSLARDDFFLSVANRNAFEAMDRWPGWPGRMLAVTGPAGSGKSHLAAIHAAGVAGAGRRWVRFEAGIGPDGDAATIVEGAEKVSGEARTAESLFHLFNAVAAGTGTILFTAALPLGGWPHVLPDLRTRMTTVHAVSLEPPDDALLKAVLLKSLADFGHAGRGCFAAAGYLALRMTRSLDAARDMARRLDARSLETKRPVGVKLAREVLDGSEPASSSVTKPS